LRNIVTATAGPAGTVLQELAAASQAMKVLAFILDKQVIERILRHIGEESTPPRVLPARSPPQLEMPFAQTTGPVIWDEVNQTTEFRDYA
jgi:hypothetical protein